MVDLELLTADETAAARAFVDERIAEASDVVPFADARCFVGCAGTFTTLSALAQELGSYTVYRWECAVRASV